MTTSVRCGHAAVVIAIATGIAELFGFPGCGIAVAQDIILEGTTKNEWRWAITPYLWGSDINTDVRFPGGQQIGGTAKFDDILNKLDFGGMLHFEGRRARWGFFVDATYLSLSDDATHGPISVDSELDTGLYEFAITYTPGESGRFTAYAGARAVDLNLKTTFSAPILPQPIRRTTDKSYIDAMIGGRYVHPFGDRWLMSLQGDIGGGDTESSWNALALLGWKFGGDHDKAVLFGWRHMEFEVEESGRQTDVTFDGPIAGVLFSF